MSYSTDTAHDITVLSAYASANVAASSKAARAPILRREAEKHKGYNTRLAVIGPGIKLLAFEMNHIGVLGDDAKKVIPNKPLFPLVKAPTPTQQQAEFYVLTYQLLFIPSTLSPSMLENGSLVP